VTKFLELAIEAIRRLPAKRQDELDIAMLWVTKPSSDGYCAAQLAAIDEGIADADAGRFASDDDFDKLFARYRTA
jgi:hypothetical protein